MVTTENFPTELCSREAKEQFARAVLKERANKRKLQVALFFLFDCRRCEFLLSYTSRKLCASSLSSQGVSLVLNMQLNWSNWVSKKNSVIMMHGILCSSSSSTRTQNQSNPKTHLIVTEVERTFKSNCDSVLKQRESKITNCFAVKSNNSNFVLIRWCSCLCLCL